MSVIPLAETLVTEGNYEQAERYYREELRIKEQNLGNGHPQVAYTLANLADLYKNMNQPPKSERAFQVNFTSIFLVITNN